MSERVRDRAVADAAQLLESLHPMREPPPPSPVAPYLLMIAAGLALGVAGFFAWRFLRRRELGLRRSAVLALAATRGLAPEERLLAQAKLLRRLVRSRYGEAAARSQGEHWLSTLDRTFATDDFTKGEGRAYAESLYRRGGTADVEALDRRLEWLIGTLPSRREPAA